MTVPTHEIPVASKRAAWLILLAMVVVLALLVVLRQIGDRLPFIGPSGPVEVVATIEDPAQLTCPDLGDYDDVGGAELPDGAVTLRLCDYERREEGSPAFFTMPSTVLTREVDAVVRLASEQAEAEYDVCPAVGGIPFAMALGYPDGDVRVITGDTGGCGTFFTGDQERFGAEIVLEDVLARLRAQRRSAPPPVVPPSPEIRCTDASGAAKSTLGVGPGELVTADLCAAPQRGDGPVVRVRLSAPELRTMRVFLTRGESADYDCRSTTRPQVEIRGVNAEGDQIALFAFECFYFTTWPVTPADESFFRRLLDRAQPVAD